MLQQSAQRQAPSIGQQHWRPRLDPSPRLRAPPLAALAFVLLCSEPSTPLTNPHPAGCILVPIVDQREYLAKFPAAFEAVKGGEVASPL